jgi:hypothetical protein
MSGLPMLAQKAGIQHTGKIIFGSDVSPFEHNVTLAYNHEIKKNDGEDANGYDKFIDSLQAGGSTDFKIVFQQISRLVAEWTDIEDLTVIFFTDGCDSVNSKQVLD